MVYKYGSLLYLYPTILNISILHPTIPNISILHPTIPNISILMELNTIYTSKKFLFYFNPNASLSNTG